MRADKRDDNEKELIAFWRAAGCVWVALHPGQGADGILLHRGHLHVIEVKSTSGGKLTDCETHMMAECERCQVPYEIVHNLDEAMYVIDSEVI